MTNAKNELLRKADEMKINIPGLDKIPEFGTSPVFIQTEPGKRIQVPNRKYTMVSDDGMETWHPVVEVSDRYSLTDHHMVLTKIIEKVDILRKVLGEPVINPVFQNNGSRMFCDLSFPNAPVKVNGDKVVPEIRIANSADLTTALMQQNRVKRLVCDNGLMISDERFPNASFRRRHTGDDLDLFIESALDSVDGIVEGILVWDKWSDQDISSNVYIEALEKIGFTDNQQEKIVTQGLRGFHKYGEGSNPTMLDLFRKGVGDTNLWAAYNSVTQFITDNTKNLKTESERSAKTSKIFDLIAK